jgi:membrane protease YdiL (CAAX protease family)
MTHYDPPLVASLGSVPPQPTPRRLALVLVLDLLIILLAWVVTSVIVVGLVVGLRAVQQGLGFGDINALGRDGMLRLIGVDGILLALIVQNVIFAGVPLLRTRLVRREPLSSIGIQAPRPLRLLGYGIATGLLLLVANAALGTLFASFGVRQNQAEQYPLFAGDYVGQALFMLGAAVLVPIGEEILFRGYLFHTLRRIGAGTNWGLPLAFVVSALLFGLAHSLAATEGVVALIVPTFVMGIGLAYVVHRTGSVLPAIVAHAMNNGVALLALVTCVNNPGLCPGF